MAHSQHLELCRSSLAECWEAAEERSLETQRQRRALHTALELDAQARKETLIYPDLVQLAKKSAYQQSFEGLLGFAEADLFFRRVLRVCNPRSHELRTPQKGFENNF